MNTGKIIRDYAGMIVVTHSNLGTSKCSRDARPITIPRSDDFSLTCRAYLDPMEPSKRRLYCDTVEDVTLNRGFCRVQAWFGCKVWVAVGIGICDFWLWSSKSLSKVFSAT